MHILIQITLFLITCHHYISTLSFSISILLIWALWDLIFAHSLPVLYTQADSPHFCSLELSLRKSLIISFRSLFISVKTYTLFMCANSQSKSLFSLYRTDSRPVLVVNWSAFNYTCYFWLFSLHWKITRMYSSRKLQSINLSLLAYLNIIIISYIDPSIL